MNLLALLACAAGSAEPPDSAEPPVCMPGLGSVELCVEDSLRYEVIVYGIDGRQGVSTFVDGPGCTYVYVEPGAWRVEAGYPGCGASTDVTLQECGTVRVAFAPDDFACGDRG